MDICPRPMKSRGQFIEFKLKISHSEPFVLRMMQICLLHEVTEKKNYKLFRRIYDTFILKRYIIFY